MNRSRFVWISSEIRYLILLITVVFLFNIIFVLVVVMFVWNVKFDHHRSSSEDPSSHYSRVKDSSSSRYEGEYGKIIREGVNSELFVSRDSIDSVSDINSFGEDEYQCEGYCSCETSRRATSLLSLSLRKFVSVALIASTSMIASKLAKEHFHVECNKRLQDSCERENIVSNVQVCSKVITADFDVKIVVDTKKNEVRKKEFFEKKYVCKGSCVHRELPEQYRKIKNEDGSINLSSFQLDEVSKGFECESYGIGYEKISIKDDLEQNVVDSEDAEKEFPPWMLANSEAVAKWLFLKFHLNDFCVAVSQTKVPSIRSEKPVKEHFCVGIHEDESGVMMNDGRGYNDDVKCKEVDDFPSEDQTWDEIEKF